MVPALISEMVNTLSLGRMKAGWWSSTYVSDYSPIVIGGSGRCGTTMFRVMLNAHPNISIGQETGIMYGGNTPEKIVRSTGADLQEVVRAYRRSSCLGRFYEEICGRVLNKENKSRWGEKTPQNILVLDMIFRFFPKARILHLIRDGRDVVCSLRTHPKYKWVEGQRVPTGIIRPWDQCVMQWFRNTSAGLEYRGDERYLEVLYDSIVEEPQRELKRVIEWLGEPWDPHILQFFKTHKETPELEPNHTGVTKPVYRDASGRWKKDLPKEARLLFRGKVNDLLMKLGFAEDDSWIDEEPLSQEDASTPQTVSAAN